MGTRAYDPPWFFHVRILRRAYAETQYIRRKSVDARRETRDVPRNSLGHLASSCGLDARRETRDVPRNSLGHLASSSGLDARRETRDVPRNSLGHLASGCGLDARRDTRDVPGNSDLWGADRWGPDLGPGHECRSGGRSTHIPWGRTCYARGVQNYLPTVCFSTFPQYPKVLPGLCFMLVSRGFPVCWIPEPLDCRIPGSPRHYCFTLCVYVAVVRCSATK